MKPTIGRIVHYVLAEGESRCVGDHRPALVTNTFGVVPAWPTNMLVTLDPANDNTSEQAGRTHLAKYSVQYSEVHLPGTWHWPEQEEA